MDWQDIENNWKELKPSIMQNWEMITDKQLEVIAGKREHLAYKIQVMYGIDYEEAEYQLNDWQTNQLDKNALPKQQPKNQPPVRQSQIKLDKPAFPLHAIFVSKTF